jgi:glycosyltransferase involved in cell wall biosynthesis
MMAAEPTGHNGLARRVLFLQGTEPAGYPPLIHASILMAEAGWDVTFLSAPIAGSALTLTSHPRIKVRKTPTRPSHVMGKAAYARYLAAAMGIAFRLRPDVIYASDPLGALPALMAARISGAHIIYHEHDTPSTANSQRATSRWRSEVAKKAKFVIAPNVERGHFMQTQIGFDPDRLLIVWNVPHSAELPPLTPISELPLVLYYHGGVAPERLPEAVVEAMRRLQGGVRLRIVGRETPGAQGYLDRLLERGHGLVEYAGEFPRRDDLLTASVRAHVGLAFMPRASEDVNMRHMTGASNKPFDYMAAGLALAVSDLPDWQAMFVAPGFARACDPADPDSITVALDWFIHHAAERKAMGARNRAKIEAEWNYETQFAPILKALSKL